jgi:hypothetical protein
VAVRWPYISVAARAVTFIRERVLILLFVNNILIVSIYKQVNIIKFKILK